MSITGVDASSPEIRQVDECVNKTENVLQQPMDVQEGRPNPLEMSHHTNSHNNINNNHNSHSNRIKDYSKLYGDIAESLFNPTYANHLCCCQSCCCCCYHRNSHQGEHI